jgi:hypothetical protein
MLPITGGQRKVQIGYIAFRELRQYRNTAVEFPVTPFFGRGLIVTLFDGTEFADVVGRVSGGGLLTVFQ